ncbi:MAG: hypothetical protein QOK16_4151 [Solirubrobacteraceae bacterium]|jgi:SAM-dependent methyltransferase|nr:hypothetical protein [Solirubrobacteraceae bacterium]
MEPSVVRPLYGRFAWAYDLVVARPAGGSPEHVARTMGSLCTSLGSLVLDAGCGTGRYAESMAAFGFRVIAPRNLRPGHPCIGAAGRQVASAWDCGGPIVAACGPKRST